MLQTWSHHSCTLTGIQVTTEQISLLTHHHVTDQTFCIIIIQRHVWDVYIIGQLCIVTQHIVQCLVYIAVFCTSKMALAAHSLKSSHSGSAKSFLNCAFFSPSSLFSFIISSIKLIFW